MFSVSQYDNSKKMKQFVIASQKSRGETPEKYGHKYSWMNGALGHLCSNTYNLDMWTSRGWWDESDDTAPRHRIRKSSPGGPEPCTLPLTEALRNTSTAFLPVYREDTLCVFETWKPETAAIMTQKRQRCRFIVWYHQVWRPIIRLYIFTPWSLDLFFLVLFQLHIEHTVLQQIRLIELIVHIVISVLRFKIFLCDVLKWSIWGGSALPKDTTSQQCLKIEKGETWYFSENPASIRTRIRTAKRTL